MRALATSGTTVCQPTVHGRLEVPSSAAGAVSAALARAGGVVLSSRTEGTETVIESELAAIDAHELQRQLPQLTGGEGLFEASFHGYAPVVGVPPSRRRSTPSPLNLKEYLASLP
jgi:ribosomal protection tetracycline resistance protein